jgi:hypothetical protein
MLRAGVDSLWLRYPMAVAIAYLAFLALLWCWLRLRRDDVLDGLDILSSGWDWGSSSPDPRCEPGGGRFGGGGASGSFDDRPRPAQLVFEGAGSSGSGSGSGEPWDVFDLEDLAFVLVAVAALAGAAWAALWMIWAAPALLAELMLDAALAAGLYRRLRGIEGDHWLRTAIRRTAGPFAAVAVLFCLAGAGLQMYAPSATSIGQVIQHHKSAP